MGVAASVNAAGALISANGAPSPTLLFACGFSGYEELPGLNATGTFLLDRTSPLATFLFPAGNASVQINVSPTILAALQYSHFIATSVSLTVTGEAVFGSAAVVRF